MRDSRKLKLLSPDKIRPNPENPRIIFRHEEMESLMLSISKLGVQVPVTVYKDGTDYYLLDGERRWRCSKKLNLKEIPALIQEKPTQLQNLLLMYNIHALREQWDYYTIATNLRRIIDLFKEERGHSPNEIELSEETGLTRGQIRRCHLLINLPNRFQDMLLKELELPKAQQKLTEDFLLKWSALLKLLLTVFQSFKIA
jgi:ParB/RepB/Spo0J family partition protein